MAEARSNSKTGLLLASPAVSMPPVIVAALQQHPDCHVFTAPFLTQVPGFWETSGDAWKNPVLSLFENDDPQRSLTYPGRKRSPFAAPCARDQLIATGAKPECFFVSLFYAENAYEFFDRMTAGFQSQAHSDGPGLWAECSRGNLNAANSFLGGSPDTKAVLFVRNGLDAALEMSRRGCSWKEACKIWTIETSLVSELDRTYASQTLTLRYEDALREPAATIDQIAGFLNLDKASLHGIDPGELLRLHDTPPPAAAPARNPGKKSRCATVEDRPDPSPDTPPINGWVNALTREWVEYFLSMATVEGTLPDAGVRIPTQNSGELMKRWGYEPARRPAIRVKLDQKHQSNTTDEGKALSKFAKTGGGVLRPNLKNRFKVFLETYRLRLRHKPFSPPGRDSTAPETTATREENRLEPGQVIDPDLPTSHYDVACVIAFHGRHWVVRQAVKHAVQQQGGIRVCAVLVASNPQDWELAKQLREDYGHVSCITHPNLPLGSKWAAGVKLARSLDPKSVMIMGSDDVASGNFFNIAFGMSAAGSGSPAGGFDMVGVRSWYVYDNTDHDSFGHRLWRFDYTDKMPLNLGAGRLYSRHLLDRLDWEIFQKEDNVGLDSLGFQKSLDINATIGELDLSEACVLSIKGSWSALNDTHKLLRARTTDWDSMDFQKPDFFQRYFGTAESAFAESSPASPG